jgi:hypothetical protein
MKILGSRVSRQYGSTPDTFIVEISLTEIQKVASKAGYNAWSDDDTRKMLSPGMDYDIAAGFDFSQKIIEATRAMTDAHAKFAAAADTMTKFVGFIQPKEPTA